MTTFQDVRVDQLVPREDNLRLDATADDELVASVREHGILQPLRVTPNGSKFYVDAGHRRLDAAVQAGLKTVPCVVTDRSYGDESDSTLSTVTMLVENMQRKDLSVREQAVGFKRLYDLGWAQKEIAAKTGFSPSIISRRIKLAELPGRFLDLIDGDELPIDRAEALVPLFLLDEGAAWNRAIGPVWDLSDGSIDRAVRQIKADRLVEKLQAKAHELGIEFVFPNAVGTSNEAGRWEWVTELVVPEPTTEDVEVYNESIDESTTKPFTIKTLRESDQWIDDAAEERVRTVGTKPLEIEAAIAEDGIDALSIFRSFDNKQVSFAAVRFVPHETDDQPADAPSSDTERINQHEADARAARQRAKEQRALQAHATEQFQSWVSGKLTKSQVVEWALCAFVAGLGQDAKKRAAKLLQLDPVESQVPKSYGSDETRTERDYVKAFENAYMAAEGAALVRVWLAATIAEVEHADQPWPVDDPFWNERHELHKAIKETFGWVDLDLTDV